ncbi:GAP family protein [Microlunatus soli]|uniref:Sap, sulfolipid-1-addressing protein n=1 Tax=Microlunatus soli TaxID=630515 RepID=A0A1H1YYA5_9ACTN|nr:GAP family protein [Microlunatus soli]SDT26430.1 Sap, sulfolipid-1-addressing protein [Microlunatus soli]
MSELLRQLLPEMLGLVITPAAIIGCLLLLASTHAFRNVALFGGTFLVVYAVLSAIVLTIGHSAGASSTDEPAAVRGWISLVVGLLFLIGGVVSWLRGRHRKVAPPTARAAADAAVHPASLVRTVAAPLPPLARQDPAQKVADSAHHDQPAWVQKLTDPTPGFVLAAALVLAIANPNIAILGSGLGIILTADNSLAGQLLALSLLLLASLLDFIVPTIVFLFAGERGRGLLRTATRWLVAHNQIIGIIVLLVFGLLFTGRGCAQILG